MCKIQEMSERKYIEHKNRIIKDLYKTIHKYNKKLTFYADKKLMMLLSDIYEDENRIDIHIQSYEEYLNNLYIPQITVCYLNYIFDLYIYSKITADKIFNTLNKMNKNEIKECNICFEKKPKYCGCTRCSCIICKECLSKTIQMHIDNGEKYKCPLCRQ